MLQMTFPYVISELSTTSKYEINKNWLKNSTVECYFGIAHNKKTKLSLVCATVVPQRQICLRTLDQCDEGTKGFEDNYIFNTIKQIWESSIRVLY